MKDVAAYTRSVIKSDRRRACHPRLEEYGLVPEDLVNPSSVLQEKRIKFGRRERGVLPL